MIWQKKQLSSRLRVACILVERKSTARWELWWDECGRAGGINQNWADPLWQLHEADPGDHWPQDTSMEPLPDLAAMDKKALESLLVELYDRSCKAFGAAFDIQQEVKVIMRHLLWLFTFILMFAEAWCTDSWPGDGS